MFWCMSSFLTWVPFHHLRISIGINYYWKFKNYDKWIHGHPKCNTLVYFSPWKSTFQIRNSERILMLVLIQKFWRLFEGLGFSALSNSWVNFYGMGVFRLCVFGFVLFVLVFELLCFWCWKSQKGLCVQGI
jgi:hypothetical protein